MTAYSGRGLLSPSNSSRCFVSENVCFATSVSLLSDNGAAADALNTLKIEFFPMFHNHAVENLSHSYIT